MRAGPCLTITLGAEPRYTSRHRSIHRNADVPSLPPDQSTCQRHVRRPRRRLDDLDQRKRMLVDAVRGPEGVPENSTRATLGEGTRHPSNQCLPLSHAQSRPDAKGEVVENYRRLEDPVSSPCTG